jgi:ABC-type antimicrobial peptide transport system permease subunit
VAGEMLTDADSQDDVLINESAVKTFGWHDPIGKHINDYTVKGVLRNIYTSAPTIEVKPVLYAKGEARPGRYNHEGNEMWVRVVVFKYQDGMWESCKAKIERILRNEYSDLMVQMIVNDEEAYDDLIKSEIALIKLLTFVSVICMLTCVFGFVSLVSLACEERRKSIAIRKINGATTNDIVSIFAKEYFLLLLIGAIIAFSTGFFIMRRWLEQYIKQTNIPAWIYLSILVVMALVIIFCVGWRVYKASVENPADVVKSE